MILNGSDWMFSNHFLELVSRPIPSNIATGPPIPQCQWVDDLFVFCAFFYGADGNLTSYAAFYHGFPDRFCRIGRAATDSFTVSGRFVSARFFATSSGWLC
jgi:hypothetical protein